MTLCMSMHTLHAAVLLTITMFFALKNNFFFVCSFAQDHGMKLNLDVLTSTVSSAALPYLPRLNERQKLRELIMIQRSALIDLQNDQAKETWTFQVLEPHAPWQIKFSHTKKTYPKTGHPRQSEKLDC